MRESLGDIYAAFKRIPQLNAADALDAVRHGCGYGAYLNQKGMDTGKLAILEMLADLLNSGCKKAHPCFRMSFFAHEARYRLCGTEADSCEGEQPEEEKALHPISLIQQEEKDFSLKKRLSLSVTIL